MDSIVVVGAGLAGLRAVQALRREEFAGEITLVGEEEHPPYNRPPLSKQLLLGEMEPDAVLYPSDDLGATLRLGESATGLDRERRVVTLAGGDELLYDGLIIATGRSARVWPGLPDLDGFFMLRSLDDAIALREAVASGSPRVVIVGAGFIGCEVAATLRGRGVEHVTLIEVAPFPLPVLGPEVGHHTATIHTREGIDLRLEARVASFAGTDRVEAVVLEGGERIAADLVLLALGAVPNTGWLEGSGLELDRGAVLCDEFCFALGADDIVAAGDVAAWPHPAAPGAISVEHWSNASEMGRHAAKNLLAPAGERTPFVPVPTFWSDQYDTNIKSVGLFGHHDTVKLLEDDGEEWGLVIEGHRDDELLGAVVFNRNRAFIGYKKALESAQSAKT